MFSRRIQQQARHLASLLIRPLARLGVTPNTLTVIGLLLSILTAWVIAQGYLVDGGVLVLFAGIFDMFDGAMARVSNTATTFGAFFDSTLDRFSESIILFGLLFYALQRPGLHDSSWPFASEQFWMITLIFGAVVGSLMVSYTKARAEGLGLECKTGLLARPERVVLLAIGLLTGMSIWAVLLLAILSQLTAIERVVYVWRSSSQATSIAQASQAHTGNSLTLRSTPAGHEDTHTGNHRLPSLTGIETLEVKEASNRPAPTAVPPFSSSVQQE